MTKFTSKPVASPRNQKGVALIMVLLILVVVTVALTQMQAASRQDLERIEARYLQQQGWGYLLGAETLARQVLTDGRIREQPRWWATIRGEPVTYPVDEGALRLQVKDLRTCYNLNHLTSITSQEASIQVRELLPWRLYINAAQENPAIQKNQSWTADLDLNQFLDLARDWIDKDNEALPDGAETGQYLLADPPRIAANQPFADVSEVNWLSSENRQRFRQLPESLCVLPDTRLRLNINTLAEQDLPLLWALFEGQVQLASLKRWWNARPDIGYTDLDSFWEDLGAANLPNDASWKQKVGGSLMFVSDFYRVTISMLLNDVTLEFEADIYLAPDAKTQIYARRLGPVDGRVQAGFLVEQEGN